VTFEVDIFQAWKVLESGLGRGTVMENASRAVVT